MSSNPPKDYLIQLVSTDVPERDLRRYHYKYLERFWSLTILLYCFKNKLFIENYSEFASLHAQLFFEALSFKYKCLDEFDGMDRDEIIKYWGDNDIFTAFSNEEDLLKAELSNKMNSILLKRKDGDTSITYKMDLGSHPQPYLPSCKQVIQRMADIFNVELTDNKFKWPFKKLSKSELKGLHQIGTKLFKYTILEDIAGELKKFDNSGLMTFSTYQRVESEVDAVYDYLPRFNNKLSSNNDQITYRIYIIYRKISGKELNRESINRNINRYEG